MTVDTLPALVRQAAAVHAGRPAIVDGDQRIDFTALAAGVMQAARGFMALGIARGDRVAIWAPNGWAWQIAALGAQSVGAVLVPLNTRWKGREAADVLARSRARALVTVVDFLGVDYTIRLRDHLRESASTLPELRDIIVVDGAAAAGARD